MSSGILKKNQKFLWVRCLAGFSGSVAQLRFACLPLAAFLDRAFQLRCRLLKANIQAARVSESRLFWIGLFSFAVACLKPIYWRHAQPGGGIILGRTNGTFVTSGTDGTRMRRNQMFVSPSPSVPIRTHIQESVGCRTGWTGRTEACVQRTTTTVCIGLYPVLPVAPPAEDCQLKAADFSASTLNFPQ